MQRETKIRRAIGIKGREGIYLRDTYTLGIIFSESRPRSPLVRGGLPGGGGREDISTSWTHTRIGVGRTSFPHSEKNNNKNHRDRQDNRQK